MDDRLTFAQLVDLLDANQKAWKRLTAESKQLSKRSDVLKRARALVQQNISSWFHEHGINSDYFPFVRLLLPMLDRERIYSLKEKGLCQLLLSSNALETKSMPSAEYLIRQWVNPSSSSSLRSEEHFADAVQNAIANKPGRQCQMSIKTVNSLLTELSTHSEFSMDEQGKSQQRSERRPTVIIHDLFHLQQPREVKWLIHIIMRTPLPFGLYDSQILGAIHPQLPKIYQYRTNLRIACHSVDRGIGGNKYEKSPGITVGTLVSFMGLRKATSAAMIVNEMKSRQFETICYAEVKYDGERMQVHAMDDGSILLYSKSKRNSTEDRLLAHDTIKQALGFPSTKRKWDEKADEKDTTAMTTVHNAILEAELLVFNEMEQRVESFSAARDFASKSSRESDLAISRGLRHYFIVFFDLLYLNGTSLLQRPLCERRRMLEKVVRLKPKWIALSELQSFDLSNPTVTHAILNHFINISSRPAEGLVIKGGYYHYFRLFRFH
jgi:DNA ligase-4